MKSKIDERKESVLNDYAVGALSVSEICSKYGVSKPGLYKALKRWGVENPALKTENQETCLIATTYQQPPRLVSPIIEEVKYNLSVVLRKPKLEEDEWIYVKRYAPRVAYCCYDSEGVRLIQTRTEFEARYHEWNQDHPECLYR